MTDQRGLRLIVEEANRDLDFIIEEKTLNSPQNFYIKGPYILVGEKNKNNRVYDPLEMELEVARYTKDMIKEDRALGELNHPASAEVNLERACHKIVELVREGNHYIGKSKILNTPMGILTRTLIQDQVKIGVSTRCLGKLINEGFGTNKVTGARLVAVDCVADPSAPKAFCQGILESKSYILEGNGHLVEVYDEFENSLSKLPKHEINSYLLEQISSFIQKLSIS